MTLHRESNYLISASWGRQYSDTLFGLPFPMTANVGLQYLAERGYQEDGLGGTAFIKAHYDWRLPFTNKYIRLGLGEGLSYVSRVPMSEQRDFAKKGVEAEKLMNYLEWTIDLPLRQFNPAIQYEQRRHRRRFRRLHRLASIQRIRTLCRQRRRRQFHGRSDSKRDTR